MAMLIKTAVLLCGSICLCFCDVFCVEAWATAHASTKKYLNILIIEWKQLNEEVNERIPDDDLERSKHVGLFLRVIKVF